MSQTMRAIGADIHNGTGPITSLFMNDKIPKPIPSAGQALVKIKAFGLNRMDLMQRRGEYTLPPQAGPILGVEFSGMIESIGPIPSALSPPGLEAQVHNSLSSSTENAPERAEQNFQVGDAVFGLAYGGAYAEYIASSTSMLIHKPTNLSWEEAAGIPETWLTATQALYIVGGFQAGETVLLHAGASGVSIAGTQLALAGGAKAVYITAGSDEKVRFCEEKVGATKGFNYHTSDFAEGILEATGARGVDVIVDFVGGEYVKKNFEVAALDGRIVQLASLGGHVVNGVDISVLEQKRLRWEGSRLRSRPLEYQARLRNVFVEKAMQNGGFGDGGRFSVEIEKIFKWSEIQEAHSLMEANTSKGKIICVVD